MAIAEPVASMLTKYPKTVLDSVQIHGWTSETVQRATSVLYELFARRSHEPTDEGSVLALELARWLYFAAREIPAELTSNIEDLRPSGENATSWDKLEILLAEDQPLDRLISCLQAHYADPVPALRTLLDEKTSSDLRWVDLDRCYQRAVEALLGIGTNESLACVLINPNLLCWNDPAARRVLVQQHGAAFTNAALTVWPHLTWHDRTMLLIVFEDSDLCKARLAEMLFAVDNTTMDYESLERYVDTLSYSDDPRAEGVIRDLIDRALDQITQAPSEAAADFLRAAAHTLVFELGKPMPVDQRRRVAKLGISLALQS